MIERRLYVATLGRVPYGDALELQRNVAKQVIEGSVDGDVLLLLEHPPVVTLGRSSRQSNLIASRELLAANGIELFEVERGGDVTFHGPGQLVGYPIFDLKAPPHKKDLHWYLRQVEQALIGALGAFGIEGLRNPGYTGVWVGDKRARDSRSEGPSDLGSTAVPQRKIASIGVHARDWVTWHGFAMNVCTDLSYFGLIVPCGIQGVTMTTVTNEADPEYRIGLTEFSAHVVTAFANVFNVQPVDAALLGLRAPQWVPIGSR